MTEDMKCFNCRNEYPHDKENGCPARNKECHECKKVGHFAQCYKNAKNNKDKHSSKQVSNVDNIGRKIYPVFSNRD